MAEFEKLCADGPMMMPDSDNHDLHIPSAGRLSPAAVLGAG
jgi:hypothetical protein